jgi:hypothetical protein
MSDDLDTGIMPDSSGGMMPPPLPSGEQRSSAQSEVKVSTPEEAMKLPPGSTFVNPEGRKGTVPYKVSTPEEVANVPDGAWYVRPDGKHQQKPKYEGVGFTAQTLYDIAHSDKGRRMALEKSYPGKVKDDPSGGFYVEDDGKFLKPGRGGAALGGFMASEAIPMTLAGVGGALGGAAGTLAEPGGGTVVGGAGGAYGGGYMGQRINDIFAQLAGVYDPEGGEANARMSGVASAAGDAGGRALFAVAPTVKEGLQQGARGASKAANKFLGTNPEKLETALPIAEAGETSGGAMGLSKPGTAVSPSSVFESAPHLTNVAEILQQKFDKSDTYIANAEKFMDKRAKEILASKDIGAIVNDSLVHPSAAVSTEKAGIVLKESAQLRAVQQSAQADKLLADELATRRAGVEAKHAPDIEQYRTRNESVVKTAEQAKSAADELVQHGFQAIEKQADDALKVAKAGYNSGDLWRTTAQSFVALRRSIGQRASKMYGDAETAAGGLVPEGSNELAQPAKELLAQLPDNFESLHPSITQKLRDIGGVPNPPKGLPGHNENAEEWLKEPADATWVQLHNLRSQIRDDIKWNDLTSDVRNGALKFLEKRINAVLHPMEDSAAPEIKEASKLLKMADAFYRENMGPLNHQQIKALVKALDVGGIQADPKALLKIAIRDGQTEVANTIKNTVGPAVWDAMRAADVQEMLAQSKQLDGSIDGARFAKEIEDRLRNRVLDVLHGDNAGRLKQQALYIRQLKGTLPIQVRPGDTAADIILRARSAAADAEKLAKDDPLKAMQNEMKKVEAAAKKEFAASRKPDPLAFLTNSTVGANEAVNQILKNPDLIVAASRAFPGGEKSAEFQLMRQIWTQRFMSETLEPGEKLAATSPEIQALMFPGVSLDDMHMLAKEMKLLMSGHTMRGAGGDMGGSMMAQSAVENPFGRASGLGKLAGPMKMLPGANFGARAALTAYYNTVRGLLTSPSTLRWLRKGLQSRDPEAKETVRAELRAALQKGGMMGASAGEAVYQGSE